MSKKYNLFNVTTFQLLIIFTFFLFIPYFVYAGGTVSCITSYRSQCLTDGGACKPSWTSGCNYCEVSATDYYCQYPSGTGSTYCGFAEICKVTLPPPPSNCGNIGSEQFIGCYMDHNKYSISPLVRTDGDINFNWGIGSPDALMQTDYFSVKWEGDFTFPTYGIYRFSALTDDGVRVYVDGDLVIDKWYDQGAYETHTSDVSLTSGTHRIKVEYYESGGDASANVSWTIFKSYPTPPVITGSDTGTEGVSYIYDLFSTDYDDDQIVYGVDWDMNDSIDYWTPEGGLYVPSGTHRGATRSWSAGVNTFQALAQDLGGLNSNWSNFTVNISGLPPVNGACGTADGQIYPSIFTQYAPDIQCASGTSSDTDFPAVGGTQNWTCFGSGSGHTDAFCEASRSDVTYTLTLNANPGPGGSIRSADNSVDTISCGSPCVRHYGSGNLPLTLIAVPHSSFWLFNGWSGDCSGTGTCIVDINSDTSISASFVTRPFLYKEL